jgi:cytochrome c oxidase cbb3-type subunit 3
MSAVEPPKTDPHADDAPKPGPAPAPASASDPLLMDHAYDGIREYDNPLPGWWMQIFVVTIVFAAAYFAYYHLGGPGKSMADWYAAESKEIAELRAKAALSAPTVTTEVIASVRADAAHLQAGRESFEMRCAPCHTPDGGGLVGPNLCDPFWIHGKGTLLDIYKTVTKGVPEKGMIAWEAQLTPTEVLEVVAYVSTLRGKTPANPKAPQGEKVDGIHD